MCMGSDLSWSKLCNDVRASKCVSSVVVLSSFQHDEDLALKSLNIIVDKELDEVFLLKSLSKSDRTFSNSTLSNTNISFKILQENFTNDTLIEV